MPRRPANSFKGLVIISSGGLTHGGGIGSVTRMIKSWMNTHHANVHVSVLDGRGEARGGAAWSLLRVPVAIAQLVFLRLVGRADIVHMQVSERLSFPRKGIFLVLGRTLGMRTVLHHHGAELREAFERASPRMRSLMGWMVQRADVNIVLGNIHRQYLIENAGAPRDRVVVHYNAGQDLFDAEHAEIDPWKFLIAANLLPRKGISDLLVAVQQLSIQGAPVSLTLAGGGQISRYRAEAHALGIDQHCHFTGWILGHELNRLFATHSALVLPSYSEGLPIAIIEALSAQLPVIATPVGSIPEMLKDEEHCLFVQPGNIEQIQAALLRVATEPALRNRLKSNGRLLYETEFNRERYMTRLFGLYSALESHGGSST